MKQSPMPPRKKRLGRTAGLPRTGGLSRGDGPSRATEMPRAFRKRKPARDTGPSPSVRFAVWDRAKGACESCGMNVARRPRSIQHRVARGMGGTSDPEANAMPNLTLLCGTATTPGSCHARCEARDPDMHERGFWLYSWENPAEVPIMAAGEGGQVPLWLTADGKRSAADPGEVAA